MTVKQEDITRAINHLVRVLEGCRENDRSDGDTKDYKVALVALRRMDGRKWESDIRADERRKVLEILFTDKDVRACIDKMIKEKTNGI